MKLRNLLPSAGAVRAPALDGATTWLNSAPLTPNDLRGHVVAYDFWTYTCVNWLRTLPYRRAWAEHYRDQGLIVVGIHTPEFAFERELANVQEEVAVDRLDYPVAIDNDYAIWRAFDNHYWPALYLADANGVIRHHQFGEGGYELAERIIRQLLEEGGARDLPRDLVDVDPIGVEVAADWDDVESPETYLRLAHGHGSAAAVENLRLNQWALDGDWVTRQDSVVLNDGVGTITYRFRARDVNVVMGSLRGEIAFRVRLDGHEPGASAGVDCDERGEGVVSQPRLYQLIRQRDSIVERTVEITFAKPGVGAYAFTFG
jgi:thiol-disulfide isomerase/thioredoxin